MADTFRGNTATGVPRPVGLVDFDGLRVGTSDNPINVLVKNTLSSKVAVATGSGDLTTDAWGQQKVAMNASLFSGIFTFDVPSSKWLVVEDGVELADAALSTRCTSVTGMMSLKSGATAGMTAELSSRRHPRYQANRGMLWSASILCPNPTNDGERRFGLIVDGDNGIYFKLKSDGLLYACRLSGGVETAEELIDTSVLTGFDVSKGNIYDIQAQWRGVGNIKFFIGDPGTGLITHVHTMNLLGTLTGLSVENPALSVGFQCDNITQEVEIRCGCVDVSSEGGGKPVEQYGQASTSLTAKSAGAGLLAMHLKDLAPNGQQNTRDCRLVRIDVWAGTKCVIKAYITRDTTGVTGGTWTTTRSGSFVEQNSTMTAVNTAVMQEFTTFNMAANTSVERTNPSPDSIEFFLVHGDYVVLTMDSGNNVDVDITIEFGEEV